MISICCHVGFEFGSTRPGSRVILERKQQAAGIIQDQNKKQYIKAGTKFCKSFRNKMQAGFDSSQHSMKQILHDISSCLTNISTLRPTC